MALKKSELYSTLWESCDQLRGSMDASQYKNYVLVMLFIKYISDKYANIPYSEIEVPAGSSFQDLVALKGKSDIGDQINKKIIAPIVAANGLPSSDFPDFNDSEKLGSGKTMVDRLTQLIAIFESPELDFSKNRSDGDDLLGDAYEFLMRHFATESGKSKGQFYTPAEVSRILAHTLGIQNAQTSNATTVYDPTCGSGSLLLKVADLAGTSVSLYGQEMDGSTAGLARMNMILHAFPTAQIEGKESTLANPKFRDGASLKQFDYVVANPPFSDKRWSTGFDPQKDEFDRFTGFGIPPDKQGDYAFLLHIVRSLKSTGKGACILPHGVLFRGNAEAEIRKNLIRRGYIKAIIGLPANLFYGTGIPACIIVIDKENAQARKGIYMIDASQGFMKDGPKNRLRARDLHKIVDAFTNFSEIPKFSRMVPLEEIEKNEFNLNLPRYIDSSDPEDIQDLEGHLKGGIPESDVDALDPYWQVCPSLKNALFEQLRPGYLTLCGDKKEIKQTIFGHPEFKSFVDGVNSHFQEWVDSVRPRLRNLDKGIHPKQEIADLSESLLHHFESIKLVDPYSIYQHLMDYWVETMQDDFYLVAADGWAANTRRIFETKKDKDGKVLSVKDKGWACDLIPKEILVAHFFQSKQDQLEELQSNLDAITAELEQLKEENTGDEALFGDDNKMMVASVKALLKAEGASLEKEERDQLQKFLKLSDDESALKKAVKDLETEIDDSAYAQYPKLTQEEIKDLVVDDKWIASLNAGIQSELDRVSQQLTTRVKELVERYESPLPTLTKTVIELEAKVAEHLRKMGLSW